MTAPTETSEAAPRIQVSVVLGSFNRRWYLQKTIAGLRRQLAGVAGEIIVVEGGSTDGSVAWLARQKDVLLILQHNRGTWRGRPVERRSWGSFMNLAMKAARGTYVLMISDDCLLDTGALAAGLAEFEQAARDGRNLGALAFPFLEWPTISQLWVRKVFGQVYVNHGLFLRAALEQVGWIDEAFRFYCADFDLCMRLRQAGYQIDVAREARALHSYHANTFLRKGNTDQAQGDTQRLLAKWRDRCPDAQPDQLNQWDFQEGQITPETLRIFTQRWRDPAFARYALATYGRAWLRQWWERARGAMRT